MDFEMLFVCWKVRPLAGNSSRKNMIFGTLIGPYASDQVRVDPVSDRIPPVRREVLLSAPLAVFVTLSPRIGSPQTDRFHILYSRGCVLYASASSNSGAWPFSATSGSSTSSYGANSYSPVIAPAVC